MPIQLCSPSFSLSSKKQAKEVNAERLLCRGSLGFLPLTALSAQHRLLHPSKAPKLSRLSARGGRAGTHRLSWMKEPGSGREESVRPGGTWENILCSHHLCPSERGVLRSTEKLKCCLMLSINCQPEFLRIAEGHRLPRWRHLPQGGCGAASEEDPVRAARPPELRASVVLPGGKEVWMFVAL